MTTQIWICLGIFLFMILGPVSTDLCRMLSPKRTQWYSLQLNWVSL